MWLRLFPREGKQNEIVDYEVKSMIQTRYAQGALQSKKKTKELPVSSKITAPFYKISSDGNLERDSWDFFCLRKF